VEDQPFVNAILGEKDKPIAVTSCFRATIIRIIFTFVI